MSLRMSTTCPNVVDVNKIIPTADCCIEESGKRSILLIDQLEKKCIETNFKKEYAKLSTTQRYIRENAILVDVVNLVLDPITFNFS